MSPILWAAHLDNNRINTNRGGHLKRICLVRDPACQGFICLAICRRILMNAASYSEAVECKGRLISLNTFSTSKEIHREKARELNSTPVNKENRVYTKIN